MRLPFRVLRRRHLRLGRAGERAAARLLELKHYAVLARDWRCPSGEIDLVARDGATLVFVEVKTRFTGGGRPAEALRRRQRERIVNASRQYQRRIDWPRVPCRYDLVEAVFDRFGLRELRHWPDHFKPEKRRPRED